MRRIADANHIDLSWKAVAEAVLRDIDAAFDEWRSKKQRGHQVSSLAYSSQAVTGEAERIGGGGRPAPRV